MSQGRELEPKPGKESISNNADGRAQVRTRVCPCWVGCLGPSRREKRTVRGSRAPANEEDFPPEERYEPGIVRSCPHRGAAGNVKSELWQREEVATHEDPSVDLIGLTS